MNNSAFLRVAAALACAALFFGGRPAHAAERLVRAGENLQAALDAAQPGDTLLLQAGAEFVGNFVLPVKSGATFITVRSATPDDQLPGERTRITPAHAPLLAKIRSGNTMSALRTARGAHHWRLMLLEFPSTREGYGDILQIGDGSSAQALLSQVPYELELDRLYIHGDPVMGQKRGIALNARAVTIRNCHISDIRAAGIDSQAIGGWNGPGPFTIENNYLEAVGENFMLGGADPYIPNLVTENVVIRQNHMARPMSWRDPVVTTPGGGAARATAGGALQPGTYHYRIIARRRVGGGVIARSAASAPVEIDLPAGAAATVSLTWPAVAHTLDYEVYRAGPSGGQYWRTSSASFNDTGAAGTVGTAPTVTGTTWTVKNLLELKNARNVLIEHNVFENHWSGAQSGYSIVFTPRNQDGKCTWCVVENVTFQRNVVRNVSAGINILGYDDLKPSAQTRNIQIRQNVFSIRSATLGGSGWFLMMGEGPRGVIVDHNTIDAESNAILYVYGGSGGSVRPVYGFHFTNNAVRHNEYGLNGAGAAFGNGVIATHFPDGIVASNWLQGGYPSRYPLSNLFSGAFESAFVNAAAGDYSVVPGGILARRASDGTDIGANIPALTTATSSVVSGLSSGPRPPGNFRLTR